MPFALAVIAIVLVIVGARGMGNIRKLRDLLVGDFTGEHNFLTWVFAIGIIGIIGYLPGLEKISRAFLVLLFVVLILGTRGSFLAKIQDAFRSAGGGSGGGSAEGGPSIGSAVAGTLNGLGGIVPSPSTGGTSP
jgi:hypothetical protein